MEMENLKIFIWGIGRIANQYLEMGEILATDLSGFIETKKSCDYFKGVKVYEPGELTEYDIILVLIDGKESEIFEICQGIGIDTLKVIFLNNWRWNAAGSTSSYPTDCACRIAGNNVDVERFFPVLYEKYIRQNDEFGERYIVVRRNAFDLIDDKALLKKKTFSENKEYFEDYFRYRTFEYCARQIMDEGIKGEVAELGVFKGGSLSGLMRCIPISTCIYLIPLILLMKRNFLMKWERAM